MRVWLAFDHFYVIVPRKIQPLDISWSFIGWYWQTVDVLLERLIHHSPVHGPTHLRVSGDWSSASWLVYDSVTTAVVDMKKIEIRQAGYVLTAVGGAVLSPQQDGSSLINSVQLKLHTLFGFSSLTASPLSQNIMLLFFSAELSRAISTDYLPP